MSTINFCLWILLPLLKISFSNALCTGETGTIVPLYLYPQMVNGVHNWQPLIDAHNNYSTVPVWAIVNVNSGPGNTLVTAYSEAINMLKTAGIKTLGYISTVYGKRSKTVVKQEVDKWKSLYQPKGIFFDEMAYENNQTLKNYYVDVNNYAKAQGYNMTVGNPGVDVPEMYVNTVDTIMIFESSGIFPTIDQYCGYHSKYPKKQWGIFPYNLQSLTENREKILAAKNCIGFIYVTNDGCENPWDSLPPYLQQLFALLKL